MRATIALVISLLPDTLARVSAATRTSSPVSDFFVREAVIGSSLIETLSSSVRALSTALDAHGGAPLPIELRALARSLARDDTPLAWSAIWPAGPSEAGARSWLRAALPRASASVSRKNDAYSAVRLSSLFAPAAFFVALRCAAARMLAAAGVERAALHELQLVTSWGNSSVSDGAPANLPQSILSRCKGAVMTAVIEGVVLAGGAWDVTRSMLTEPFADSSDTAALPRVMIAWVPSDAPPVAAGHSLSLPLFVRADRAVHLSDLTVKAAPIPGANADEVYSRWIMNGACLLGE